MVYDIIKIRVVVKLGGCMKNKVSITQESTSNKPIQVIITNPDIQIIEKKDTKTSINEYLLFINGKDIKTNIVDYSIDADTLIKNPLQTIKSVSLLKKNLIKESAIADAIIGKYYLAEETHIYAAFDSARSSYEEFKNHNVEQRALILKNVKKELINNKDEFISLIIKEGHPYKLAVWEYENMISGVSNENIQFYIELLKKEVTINKEKIIFYRKPDGVILVIPPRNAPASNSFLAISALITGNTLVIKPPQKLPISTVFLWRNIVVPAIIKAGFSPSIINIIQGNSSIILNKALASDKISTIFNFGESSRCIELGKKIYEANKKPILELSGNDIFTVFPDAKITNELIDSALECFLGSTQICMVPKLFFVHENIYDEFVEKILLNIQKVKPGLPSNKDTWLSPVGKVKDYFKYLEDAQQKGAKVLIGGNLLNYKGELDKKGMFIQPTVLAITDYKEISTFMLFEKEIFFPLMPIIKFGSNNQSEDDTNFMIDTINAHKYGLRTSFWTNNKKIISKLVQNIVNSGTIRINSRHIGISPYLSSHGGTSLSGGAYGEMNYMCLRASHMQGISITE